MQDKGWRHLYHLHRSQLLRIVLWMHELHEAVIVHLTIDTGLTGLERLHSNPGLLSSICQDLWHTGLSPPMCRYISTSSIRSVGTVSSWLYCRIAALTSSTVSLIVSQICSAVVDPESSLNILNWHVPVGVKHNVNSWTVWSFFEHHEVNNSGNLSKCVVILSNLLHQTHLINNCCRLVWNVFCNSCTLP